MMEEKILTQSKFGVRLRFQFQPDKLTYHLRDHSGACQCAVPYEAINVFNPSMVETKNPAFVRRLILILFVATVAFAALQSKYPMASAKLSFGSIVLFLILVIARYFGLFTLRYTLLGVSPVPSGGGNHLVRIIKGKDHDAVFEEIMARWKERMRKLHSTVDPTNDPNKEIAKFSWMREVGVISEEELRSAVAQVRGAAAQDQPEPEGHVLN